MPRGARGRGRSAHPPVLKRYGQHFLSDPGLLAGIVGALAPGPADTVVEIGPGRGSLTDLLAERSRRVVAIEIDSLLADALRKRYATRTNVEVVEADVLEIDIASIAGADYLLIGNVPYYITTPIIFKALEAPIPRRSVFLVQREVAERMIARADTESYGALSVNIGVVADVEIVMSIPASAFKPPPNVESSVVRITPRAEPLVAAESLAAFRTFVQAVFGQRRKQFQRVLRTVGSLSAEDAVALLEKVGIDPAVRPEVVSPESFARLFDQVRVSGKGN